VALPFAAVHIAAQTGAVPLDPLRLRLIAGVLLVLGLLLSVVRRATFQREEIPTRCR
jgi:hypothetical protein